MVIKLVLLSGNSSPVVNELRTDVLEGFQVRDVSKPGRYHIRMFDDSGELIDLVFGFAKGQEASISQADVNCVLLSLRKLKTQKRVAPTDP